ncbi:MAG: 3-methyladenine DNA glycosylase AlkC [Acidimicrobiales bacterium]|jgi:3-methyladenine DNA glycosylase AlkC
MAEPLKNSFGPEVVERIGRSLAAAQPGFDEVGFVAQCLRGFDELELTPRARQIADVMADHLDADRALALQTVIDSVSDEALAADLGPDTAESTTNKSNAMSGFFYLPHVFFVTAHGLDHFELAMDAQHLLTRRFTAEFSIRAYLEHHTEATLVRLREWTLDPSEHVRRLVSEGTRPRLPWASRLKEFQRDPAPVLELLELLKDDESEYVRRSVANNLNDIAKDHPELIVGVAQRWWTDGDDNRRRLIRHGLRSLIKAGDPGALGILGYVADSPLEIHAVSIEPATARIGETVKLVIELTNPTDTPVGGLVDLAIHFVKANGSTSSKVFKGSEIVAPSGGSAVIRKSVSVAQQSTRTHYPGEHAVDVLINGVPHRVGAFTLEA